MGHLQGDTLCGSWIQPVSLPWSWPTFQKAECSTILDLKACSPLWEQGSTDGAVGSPLARWDGGHLVPDQPAVTMPTGMVVCQ